MLTQKRSHTDWPHPWLPEFFGIRFGICSENPSADFDLVARAEVPPRNPGYATQWRA